MIKADTRWQWLDKTLVVVVLDLRPHDQREEWAIPGSICIDVYDAPKEVVETVLARIPATPPNYLAITERNMWGPFEEREQAELGPGPTDALFPKPICQ